MRSLSKGIVVAALFVGAGVSALQAGHVNFTFGPRTVDEDFEPAEEQDVFGVNLFLGGNDRPVFFALGFLRSDGEETGTFTDPFLGTFTIKAEAELSEFYVGAAKVWSSFKHVRPFFGGGVSYLTAEFNGSVLGFKVDDDDSVLAPYLNAGVFWRLGEAFNLGLDARIVANAEVELFGIDGNADYTQVGLLIGWGW